MGLSTVFPSSLPDAYICASGRITAVSLFIGAFVLTSASASYLVFTISASIMATTVGALGWPAECGDHFRMAFEVTQSASTPAALILGLQQRISDNLNLRDHHSDVMQAIFNLSFDRQTLPSGHLPQIPEHSSEVHMHVDLWMCRSCQIGW